jgi:MEMO1 family protein
MTTPPPTLDIRPSPIIKRGWYEADPDRLAAKVDDFIARAEIPAITGRLVGVLAPHAGHRYSGPVAGYAFKAVQGMDVDLVVVVGPSHHLFPGTVLTTAHDAFWTPLGLVPVANDLIDALRAHVPLNALREDPEHAIEIELPFLQRVLGNFRLLPLWLMDQSLALARQLGNALAEVVKDKKVLLVASSDLSHFYPQAVANQLDQQVLDAVNAYNPAAVITAEADGRKIACGHGALSTVMIAAQHLGANTAQVINYATSGDVSHDYHQVVGYSAALFSAQADV